ncbi:MAG TPA: GNAT family N-acetyltransferase [Frankiaceae bacterium]|nr:GNAT family N-acetyltransferase [Frankiaceae bacterium]
MGLRRATSGDIDDLVRLRGVMFDAMGVDTGGDWRAPCADVLRRCLADGTMAAYVVEEDGAVVACGVGMLAQRLPSPRNPSGRYGYVQSMATDEHARRRGHAHAIFAALMDWFGDEGVVSVGLHATDAGARVYRSFGFSDPRNPELTWHG